MRNLDWFRFYTETINDRKLRRLNPAQRWLWVTVLSIARSSPEPGKLLLSMGVPVTIEDLIDAAAITKKDVQSGLKSFVEQKMLHLDNEIYVITNWNQRQFVSDTSNERVKRYRERQKNDDVTLHETLSESKDDVIVTPPDTDTETDLKDCLLLDAQEREVTSAQEQEIVNTGSSSPTPLSLHAIYERYFGRRANPVLIEKISLFITQDRMEIGLVELAFQLSREGAKDVKYAEGILSNWAQKGITSVDQAHEEQKRREEWKHGKHQHRHSNTTGQNRESESRFAYLTGNS